MRKDRNMRQNRNLRKDSDMRKNSDMRKKLNVRKITAVLLLIAMLVGVGGQSLPLMAADTGGGRELKLTEIDPEFDVRLPGSATDDTGDKEGETADFSDDDVVRVSIVLKKEPVIEKGYSLTGMRKDKKAIAYREKLLKEQDKVTAKIEKKVLGGKELAVKTNLALVANVISADVKYGQIDDIKKVSGVKDVVIEQIYEPYEDPLDQESGSTEDAKKTGAGAGTVSSADEKKSGAGAYGGAGTKIAILDSGVNYDHASFNGEALLYSLGESATDSDGDGTVSEEEKREYIDGLGLMDEDDVKKAGEAGKLLAAKDLKSGKLYRNAKVPFAYNYCDSDAEEVKNATGGIHGSHVAGIAAANAYLPDGDSFTPADDAEQVVGAAPDAQILNMKVMGYGLCTDAVVAAAIEDSIILGADVLNLSFGTAKVGYSCSDAVYGDVLIRLLEKGMTILGAVGNDGSWVLNNRKKSEVLPPYLYADDINWDTTTPPSSYADIMGVAWADGPEAAELEGFPPVDELLAYPTIDEYSSYGIPSSLKLQPEITAFGTNINSVKGDTDDEYKKLSGTSMASPEAAGMAARIYQYIRQKDPRFGGKSFLEKAQEIDKNTNAGKIVAGLLMSTASPMKEKDAYYYTLMRQGAGLANVEEALAAQSFIDMKNDPRGRVKAEVGDSEDGSFKFSFTINNVSGTKRYYSLNTDLFTQKIDEKDGTKWLSEQTRKLKATVTYSSGGHPLDFATAISADVNRDGKTDDKDATALLDYISGKERGADLDLEAGDLDRDKKYTAHDAHLILAGLAKKGVAVPAGSSVTIDVDIRVTDKLEGFSKGAYLEGFTYVTPVMRGDDASLSSRDAVHSIPIIGYCGNWSEPSMFDRNTYVDKLYLGNMTQPYTTSDVDINCLTYLDDNGNKYRLDGNPFMKEDEYPQEKLAISADSIIYSMEISLIRPAAAQAFVVMVKDKDGKREVRYVDSFTRHAASAFNNGGKWNFSETLIAVNNRLRDMNVKEGEVVELGAVAIPEYYEENGEITIERFKKLIEEDELGSGAYMLSTVTVDSEAPTCKANVTTDGKIEVTATDNKNVAYIGMYNTSGTKKYDEAIPRTSEKDGESVGTGSLDTSKLKSGAEYVLVAGDYAGNVTMYRFTYGDKPLSESNGTLVYVRETKDPAEICRGSWLLTDPEKVAVNTYAFDNLTVCAAYTDPNAYVIAGADAAGDYIWQACEDGRLYVAPLDCLNDRILLSDLAASGVGTVRDLTFNGGSQMLYAVDGSDVIRKIDPVTGDVSAAATVTVSGEGVCLYGLAAADDGAMYATYYDADAKENYILKIELGDIEDESKEAKDSKDAADGGASRKVSVDENGAPLTGLDGSPYISLAWEKSEGRLLAAFSKEFDTYSNDNILYSISPENGTFKVEKANNSSGSYASYLYGATRGLICLDSRPNFDLTRFPEEKGVTALRIIGAPSDMLVGDKADLFALPIPWYAVEEGARITWSSSDEAVVKVDAESDTEDAGDADRAGVIGEADKASVESGATAEGDVSGSAKADSQVDARSDGRVVATGDADSLGVIGEADSAVDVAGLGSGHITATGAGPAEITATYSAPGGKEVSDKVNVNVSDAPHIQLSALVRESDGFYYWETFDSADPNGRIRLSEPSVKYIVGTMNPAGDSIYVQDGPYPYKVDPWTFEQTTVWGSFDQTLRFGDATIGRTDGPYKEFEYLNVNTFKDKNPNTVYFSNFNEKFAIHPSLGGLDVSVATITHKGTHLGDHATSDSSTSKTVDEYYFFTSDGVLYEMNLFEGEINGGEGETGSVVGDRLQMTYKELGKVEGVDLTGVGNMESFSTGSMIYDETSKKIALVSKINSGVAKVQIIDPDSLSVVTTREFAGGVRQIGILYQYNYSAHPKVQEALSKPASRASYEGKSAETRNDTRTGGGNTCNTASQAADVATAGSPSGTVSRISSSAGEVAGLKGIFDADVAVSMDENARTVTFTYPINLIASGLVTLRYDPKVLTFVGEETDLAYYSCHDAPASELSAEGMSDAGGEPVRELGLGTTGTYRTVSGLNAASEDGTREVRFAFADSSAINGGVAKFIFSYEEKDEAQRADVNIQEEQKGDPKANLTKGSWTETVEIPAETQPPEERMLVGVSVKTLPTKREYLVGEEFSDEGMELLLTYSDGTTETVRSGWTIEHEPFDTPGEKKVTVTYEGKTDTFTVTVKAKDGGQGGTGGQNGSESQNGTGSQNGSGSQSGSGNAGQSSASGASSQAQKSPKTGDFYDPKAKWALGISAAAFALAAVTVTVAFVYGRRRRG